MNTPKTPNSHKKHNKGIPCGCWVGQPNVVSCKYCGASYDAWEVMEFPVFRCYDCEAGIPTNIVKSK